MAGNAEQERTILRLWLLLRRVGDALAACQDAVYDEYGLNTEQFSVLASIKSRGPLRPADFASLLERSPNTMTMLIGRMVKAGLVRRTRDRKDRRMVFVGMTDNGRRLVEPAIPAGWEFIHKVVSSLSDEERRSLAESLEKVKSELVCCLNPEMDRAEVCKGSFTRDPELYERMVKGFLAPWNEDKPKVRNKRKQINRTGH
jgi:MarR family 2-MHQ and catechol resistance regulon transcriptional repressor